MTVAETLPPRERDRGSLILLEAPPDDDALAPLTPSTDTLNERAVLGALMHPRNTDALHDVTATLNPGDFVSVSHEAIYAAVLALYARGRPVDPLTVSEHIGPDLRRHGGDAYLHQLVAGVATTSSAGYHATLVAKAAAKRRLVQAGQRIQALGTGPTTIDTDVSDLLEAAENQLAALPRGVPGVESDQPVTSWSALDLTDYLDGTHEGPRAAHLRRRDGKALLYPYAVHSVAGEPGSGKTWAGLLAIVQELDNGHDAGMIDFEDRAATAVNRLLCLGATRDQIRDHFRYVRPDQALDPAAGRELDRAVGSCTVVIIDGVTEAMGMHGLAINDNDDVARWLHLLPNRVADLGPAVLQIDHVTKDSDTRGRYAIGAQHKLAGITGVAYKLVTYKSFGKGVKGHAKLVIDKDKHGDVGPNGLTVADLHLDATDPGGTVYGWLDTPGQESTGEDGHFRPTTLMKRVSGFLAAQPGASLREIRVGVRGKNESIAAAVDALVLEGFVRTETGGNRTVAHYLEKHFGDDDE